MQANVLQPLTDINTIRLRYDVVEELLASDELLSNVRQCLASLPCDLDKVCNSLVTLTKLRTESFCHACEQGFPVDARLHALSAH